jgi:hypothetical protein
MKLDSDTGEQARRFAILVWSGVGGFFGTLLGLLLARSHGWPTIPTILGLFVLGGSAVYFIADWISVGAANAAAKVLVPSGSSTPSRAEYSRADSLVARGRYEEAVAAYAQHASDSPHAAEPCARLARLYRDRLQDGASAADWLRRARDRASHPAEEHLLTRELVELLVNRLGDIASALPELARLADRHGETPSGAWARAEIGVLKARLSA